MRAESNAIRFVLAASLGVALSCGPGREIIDDACANGETKSCACDSGSGTATCSGGQFGACVCSAACDASSCSPSDAGHETDAGTTDAGMRFCEPGLMQSCTCPNLLSGIMTCNEDGSAYGSCVCASNPSCTQSALTGTGSVSFSGGSISFEGATVGATFHHPLASGTSAGCIATADLLITPANGHCALALEFGSVAAGSGGLIFVSLNVDSSCQSATGLAQGTYTGRTGYGLLTPTLTSSVPNTFTDAFCMTDQFIQFGSTTFELRSSGGASTSLNLVSLGLTGKVFTSGSHEVSCYASSTCASGYKVIQTAWCTPIACGIGEHDGGDGVCVPSGTCSSGYHDGGSGLCVELSSCSVGFHDGGDGACRTNGTCSSGYHDGGHGFCVVQGACDSGYHDGGNGSCLVSGSCISGFVIDNHGGCVSATNCNASPPVANAGSDHPISIGTPFTVDASASSGVPNLQYTWSLTRPIGSSATLSSTMGSSVTFTPDLTGDYRLDLTVLDGRSCSAATFVTLVGVDQPPSVTVRVTWSSDHGDVDLHYFAPGGSFHASNDCYYGAPTPDWSPSGSADFDSTNDPSFGGDTRWGGSVGEHTQHDKLFDGEFTPAVHYYCSRQPSTTGTSTGSVSATIHVLVNGSEVFTQNRTLSQRDLWSAARITVTGGGTSVFVSAGNQTVTSLSTSANAGGCTDDAF